MEGNGGKGEGTKEEGVYFFFSPVGILDIEDGGFSFLPGRGCLSCFVLRQAGRCGLVGEEKGKDGWGCSEGFGWPSFSHPGKDLEDDEAGYSQN